MADSMSFRSALRPGAVALAALLAIAACRPALPSVSPAAEDWTGFGDLENVLNWIPEQQLRGYRNIDRIYPTRPVSASTQPFPLPDEPADFSGLRYTVDAAAFDLDGFISHNQIVGLLAIRDGAVVLERYAQGNTRETPWYSFSVAKSVVSMLVGAAVHDGFLPSIDVPVVDFLPLLRGSAYEAVTLRQAMTMSSGVAWDEDYADPRSDIAQTGGSALSRLHYLLQKPRVAPPGSTFNYNTEETNLVGAVLRAAIGNNLATYLDDRIWGRFGMEHDANWLLLSESGAEHGGCCLSATLRDYGRLGLFALRNGRLADGTSVLPDGWMEGSTAASATNDRYGLLWWRRGEHAYAAVGIYGQAIYINPPCRLVVVTHSAWPRATDRERFAHREALFGEMATWAAAQDGGGCTAPAGD
jgi:CubicO group peptidase (beta-lactamase class C family)